MSGEESDMRRYITGQQTEGYLTWKTRQKMIAITFLH